MMSSYITIRFSPLEGVALHCPHYFLQFVCNITFYSQSILRENQWVAIRLETRWPRFDFTFVHHFTSFPLVGFELQPSKFSNAIMLDLN